MASRETKCRRFSIACAGQINSPVQRRRASTLPVLGLTSRTASEPHTGQIGLGRHNGTARLGPLVEHDGDDLRNHVPGPLDDHRIAHADIDPVADRRARRIPPCDIVLVVQRGVLHHHAAHGHRLQPRHGRQRAGAPDLDIDALEDGASPARRGTCGRWPSAAPARQSPSAAAGRAGRACRPPRRYRSPASRAAPRSRDNARAAPRRASSGSSEG